MGLKCYYTICRMEDVYPLELDGSFSNFSSVTISLTVGIVPNLTIPFGIIVSKDGSNACFVGLWGNANSVVTEHLQEHLAQREMRCECRCLQSACIQLCHLGPRALLRVSRHAGRVTAGSSRWHSVCPHPSSQCHIPHLPPCDLCTHQAR